MNNYIPQHPAKLPENLRAWARELRGRMTDAETLLWKLVRDRRIAGAKFRRQHAMEFYILDFYCKEKKLCIEIDGSQHAEAIEYDTRRDAWLQAHGIRVLRFWNNQVLMETESVLEVIYDALIAPLLTDTFIPGPSPACGRRENLP